MRLVQCTAYSYFLVGHCCYGGLLSCLWCTYVCIYVRVVRSAGSSQVDSRAKDSETQRVHKSDLIYVSDIDPSLGEMIYIYICNAT